MDVSADLSELGRTPIAVVCAGAKSVLDIPRTLEVLETWVRGLRGGKAAAARRIPSHAIAGRRTMQTACGCMHWATGKWVAHTGGAGDVGR